MRYVKLCLVVGLILAVSGTAGALSIGVVGPTTWKATSYELGTTYYSATPGTYTWDGTNWNGPGTLTETAATGADAGEDIYGVFWITEFGEGTLNAPFNTIDPGSVTWQQPVKNAPDTGGQSRTFVMGYFWGGVDQEVKMYTDGHYDVKVDDLKFRLLAVDLAVGTDAAGLGLLLNPSLSSTHETDVDKDFMANWPTGSGTLLLEGTSESFVFTGNPASSLNLGVTDLFLNVDVDKGDWGYLWDTNWFTSAKNTDADIRMDWVIKTMSTNKMILDSDYGGAVIIPEPLTMLAVFTGIAGLGGYIRKRRLA